MAGTREKIVRFMEILLSSKITLVNFLSVPPLIETSPLLNWEGNAQDGGWKRVGPTVMRI